MFCVATLCWKWCRDRTRDNNCIWSPCAVREHAWCPIPRSSRTLTSRCPPRSDRCHSFRSSVSSPRGFHGSCRPTIRLTITYHGSSSLTSNCRTSWCILGGEREPLTLSLHTHCEHTLIVKWKVVGVDVAWALVNCWWIPFHSAIPMLLQWVLAVNGRQCQKCTYYDGLGHDHYFVVPVGTGHSNVQWLIQCSMHARYTYLLYSTMSGNHICSDGTYSWRTPPYSLGSHFNLWSNHSWKLELEAKIWFAC